MSIRNNVLKYPERNSLEEFGQMARNLYTDTLAGVFGIPLTPKVYDSIRIDKVQTIRPKVVEVVAYVDDARPLVLTFTYHNFVKVGWHFTSGCFIKSDTSRSDPFRNFGALLVASYQHQVANE